MILKFARNVGEGNYTDGCKEESDVAEKGMKNAKDCFYKQGVPMECLLHFESSMVMVRNCDNCILTKLWKGYAYVPGLVGGVHHEKPTEGQNDPSLCRNGKFG